MPLAVYVHIPYCLQRCRYCDFTTFEWREILPPEAYVAQVREEIRRRHHLWPERELATLYFGGGTPSLIAADLIVSIRAELEKAGFTFTPDAELTIEINPATVSKQKLETYLAAGINRFSVGAQSFNDALLSTCGRRHSAEDTRETLRLLAGHNYSFDLLFALPGQTMDDLARDLDEVASFAPPHLSAYCLTVPEGHPMSRGRPPEDAQLEMFDLIERRLGDVGLLKYEISNFARPGFESRHNSAYWADRSYWGIGVSAHSYRRDLDLRFWNPKSLKAYGEQVGHGGDAFTALLPDDQFERLAPHEALTDLCHMFLRTRRGLGVATLRAKAPHAARWARPRLERLVARGWLAFTDDHWSLTRAGELVSNRVFEELTFLKHEVISMTASRTFDLIGAP